MHPDEIEEMDYQANARYDYLSEAYGDTGDCGEDEDPDFLVGGIPVWFAVEAMVRGLNLFMDACERAFDPDYIPF